MYLYPPQKDTEEAVAREQLLLNKDMEAAKKSSMRLSSNREWNSAQSMLTKLSKNNPL